MIFPNCEKLGQTIIFVRTQMGARELWKAMDKDGYKCTCIEVSVVAGVLTGRRATPSCCCQMIYAPRQVSASCCPSQYIASTY